MEGRHRHVHRLLLAPKGGDVIVIERKAIACAASGKSGGFLAMDWCDGTPLMHLARRSFALHAELAEGRAGDWGYRRMTTYGGIVGGRSASASRGAGPGWVSTNVSINGQLGSICTTGCHVTVSIRVERDMDWRMIPPFGCSGVRGSGRIRKVWL